MTKIISVNAGSSSLKFQLFEMPSEDVLTSGVIERIGLSDGIFNIKVRGEKIKKIADIPNHKVAVQLLLDALIELNVVDQLTDITGVGHRVVHGGEFFERSVVITDDVVEKCTRLFDLAPLHNPANMTGYHSFKEALPDATHVVVFDTAFHQTMAPEHYLYPIPYQYYEDYKIRKYGFHGTSHLYVSQRYAEIVGKDVKDVNVITCHLGNGASVTAIEGGKSVNTSMGFTPLAGVMMGTRSGDIDPSIVSFLAQKLHLTAGEIIDILNKKSGMLGVSRISSDAREIEDAYNNGNADAILTRKMYANRIAATIGAYYVQLGRVDAIIFTAGLGENDYGVRENVMDLLVKPFNLKFDREANMKVRGREVCLTTPDSSLSAWLIPTNEELVIAQDTYQLMQNA
jgi:acetate kinase